jgi:cyanate permease
LLAAGALSGAALAVSEVLYASAIQREVPEERLGQVFGYDYLLSEAIAPLGFLVVPVLARIAGSQESLLAWVSGGLLTVLVIAALCAPKTIVAAPSASSVAR